MPRSRRAPTGWRIICARSGSGPRPWSGCASSARSRWWSGSSASSRRAAPICRSIPAYPPERLAFMLADAGAPVLVTQAALLERLPAHGARIVRLDADWPAIARAACHRARRLALDPQHPAYVIYTSGSTGTPKGVVVTHAEPCQQHACGAAGLSEPEPGSRIAQLRTPCVRRLGPSDLGAAACRQVVIVLRPRRSSTF